MARSYKKTFAGGITNSSSEKTFKQISNRKTRRINKAALDFFGEDFEHIDRKVIENVWNGPKDGKTIYTNISDNPWKIIGK